jgi:hypothetical protein
MYLSRTLEKLFSGTTTSATFSADIAPAYPTATQNPVQKDFVDSLGRAAPMFDPLKAAIGSGLISARGAAAIFKACAAFMARGASPLREYFANPVIDACRSHTGRDAERDALVAAIAEAVNA